MKISREDNLPENITLNIELGVEDVEPYLENAYRKVVARLRIPGFRPGKAPRNVVESVVGREHLVQEALDSVVPACVDEAIREENIDPFLPPEVEMIGYEPLSFRAIVPLEPELILPDYGSIRINVERKKVGDGEVEEVLDRYRSDSAPWVPVERSVKFGDLVTLDVEGRVELKTILKQERIDYIPSMENQSPLPGFSVQLEGLERGITKTFSVKVPDEYTDETIKGKDCHFTVTVNEIKEKLLPILDDEFAKGIGEGFETLDDLRADILDRLNRNMDLQAQEEFNEQALQEVVDKSVVVVPDLIIKREVDNMVDDQQRALKSRNIDLDSYLNHLGKSEDELREEMRPAARERVVRNLVLKNLSKEFNIEISDSEVESQIKDMFAGANKRSIRRVLKSDEVKKSVSISILNRKAMENLVNLIKSNKSGKPKSKTASKTNILKK